MDLSLTDEQQQLRASFAAFFARHCPPEVVREAEPLGFSAELWKHVIDLGAVSMALPETMGGGASLLELGLVTAEAGRWLAPVPLVEAIVANRLLAAVDADVSDDAEVVVFAPRQAVGDVADLVPGGAVAARAIVLRGTDLLSVAGGGAPVANLGLGPLARLSLVEADVIASGEAARRAFDGALAEWRALTATALAALAAQALEIGVEYAKAREAFGVPIGSFQAVAHALADAAAAARGAELLATEATWAWSDDPGRFDLVSRMAFAFAARAAQQASLTALHVHGGYGFMLEYDIQMYFRRARAWPLALGDPRHEVRALGALALEQGAA